MKITALLTAGLLTGFAASAQIAITGSSLTYSQDFDMLSMDTSEKSDLLPAGWVLAESGTGSANDGKYKVGNGSTNNGDTYSFGANGSSDRALGSIASGSLKPIFGASFINNTGGDITGFTISYSGEQWRLGRDSIHRDSLIFQYSTTAAGVGDAGTTDTWVTDTSLMLNSIIISGTVGMLDGNAPSNSVFKTGTVTFSTPVADGATFVIRWKDWDIKGADDGLAIDDLTINFMADSVGTGITSVPVLQTQLMILGQPSNGNIQLAFNLQQAGPLSIEVLDLNGQVIHHETIQGIKGMQQYQISNQNMAAGLYVIRIRNGKEAAAVKTTVK